MIQLNNRLKTILRSNSLDYLLVSNPLNIYYLTGYRGRLGFRLISRLGERKKPGLKGARRSPQFSKR